MADTYRGSCFCGAVQVEVKGSPMAMGYCHCDSCRHWGAAPVTAFSLWSPESVTVIEGEDRLLTFAKSKHSQRESCTICGGHVMSKNLTLGFTDVYPAILPDLAFEPAVHVFYEHKVLSVHDGLPKMKDVPAEMGGSGETLPE